MQAAHDVIVPIQVEAWPTLTLAPIGADYSCYREQTV